MGLFDRLGDRMGKLFDEVFVPEEVRELLEEGRALLEREPKAALFPLQEAVARRGDFPEARLLLGVARLTSGDAPGAVQELSIARDLAPQNTEIALELGRALLALGEIRPAKLAFREALASERTRAGAYAGLGETYVRAKEYFKAIREYQKALSAVRRNREELSPSEKARLELRLGEAYAALGEEAAIPHLRRAAASSVLQTSLRVRAYLRLGEALRKSGDLSGTVLVREEATLLEAENAVFWRLLAAAKKAVGDFNGAKEAILQALTLAPNDPAAHNLLGTLQRENEENQKALDSFQKALSLDPNAIPIARNAARAALSLGKGRLSKTLSHTILQKKPSDPVGLAARGLGFVMEGDTDAAITDLEAALQTEESLPPDAEIVLGRALLSKGNKERALLLARRAVEREPDYRGGREFLAELCQPAPPPEDLAGLCASFYAFSTAHPEFAHLAPRAEESLHAIDRPMLLVVMGEFNAGKSTFVNALVSEQVAAIGVTPTTATINVLKHGPEKKARIWRQNSQSEDMSLEALQKFLKNLSPEDTRKIDRVELFLPNPALERVNLVDTPGLNSLLPEHEEITRRFVDRADAVIWLFDVRQAGKKTERGILALVKEHRAKTLGVVNKIDRVNEEEKKQVFRFLTEELDEYFEAILGVSAKKALEGELSGSQADIEESGFVALRSHLQAEYFTPSRLIVEAGVKERLRTIAWEATEVAAKRLTRLDAARSAIHSLRDKIATKERAFQNFATKEAGIIGVAVLGLAKNAAEEVLDFARPRRSLWGGNETDPEDREYLLQILEQQLTEIVTDAREKAKEQVSAIFASLAASLEESLPEDPKDMALDAARARAQGLYEASQARTAEMTARVYDRFLAFAMGYLRGGRLDSFFSRTLPRLDLDLPTIESALKNAFPIETENGIARPLLAWSKEAFLAWEEGIQRLYGAITAERVFTESALARPARTYLEILS